ncbi:MAG: alpha/beta fold hydrolase, partial [Abditibacteriaceae bacterium]
MFKYLFAFVIFLLPFSSSAAPMPRETVFDVPALISTPLDAKVLTSTEKEGIVTEEVMFHSEMDGAKSVDIFAFFSYPKGAQNLPAFIWNQAGMGQANTYFTELGAKRGYAALCIDLPLSGYRSTGGYSMPSSPDLKDIQVNSDPKQTSIYHCAVALLKAVSFLESRTEVDKTRIGMAGSSWGGFITTLMIGFDPRLKVGSAMFGDGAMQEGNVWWDGNGQSAKRDAAYRAKWKTTLDPAWRLQFSKTPIAWFSGTNDNFYWMPSLMKSYEMADGPKHLSLFPNWDHGLPPIGDEQVFVWLDTYLKGAPPFLQVAPIKLKKRGGELFAQWKFSGARQAQSANLILSYGEAGNWQRRAWITLPAQIVGDVAEAKLPPSQLPIYISGTIFDTNGFRTSTPLLEVSPSEFGKAKAEMIEYDGAAMWGGFEPEQMQFLDGLGWPHPPASKQARTGAQSAELSATKTVLPPLNFTAGVPHRFTAFLKSDTPVTV